MIDTNEPHTERLLISQYIKILTEKSQANPTYEKYLNKMKYIKEYNLSVSTANEVMRKAKIIS